MKPPGIGLGVSGGAVVMYATGSDRATDKLWDAVDEAITAGMTPERFKREMVAAWEHHRKQQTKWELEELQK